MSDGGIVVEDCLILLLNLLKDNKSNQTLFVEGNYVSRLTGFFNVEALTAEEVSWSAQKVCNVVSQLGLITLWFKPMAMGPCIQGTSFLDIGK